MKNEFIVPIPDGMEIDKERSTFECIKFKPKLTIETWDDLNHKGISGFYIDTLSQIQEGILSNYQDKNVALTKSHCKMMLAISQISQLMPYYGGIITDEEWEDKTIAKCIVKRSVKSIVCEWTYSSYNFLAFHTKMQFDDFLKNNKQLVKDFLMLDLD